METQYAEVSKYFLQEVVGRNLLTKDRLDEFKKYMQNHLEVRMKLQTRNAHFPTTLARNGIKKGVIRNILLKQL